MANLPVTKRAPATVTNIGTVAARRRTNGRTKLQQEQKESSRQSLLDAAQRLYIEESYAMTTVDDIVREAQVSRTTFYRHFDSKLAIADALFQQAMMPLRPIHEALASHADPGESEIALWMNRVLDQLEAHRTLVQIMREVEVVEPDSHSARHDAHKDLIQLYGKKIPAFRQASSDGPRHADGPNPRAVADAAIRRVPLCRRGARQHRPGHRRARHDRRIPPLRHRFRSEAG
jgi:AcrR family transcriptional regulator